MKTVDQLAAEKEQEERIDIIDEGDGSEYGLPEDPARAGIDLSFLRAQTGDGEIEDYLTHPLNFAKSHGLAQVIRGLTGMLGELRYAIVDILMGAMRFSQERKTKGGAAIPHE